MARLQIIEREARLCDLQSARFERRFGAAPSRNAALRRLLQHCESTTAVLLPVGREAGAARRISRVPSFSRCVGAPITLTPRSRSVGEPRDHLELLIVLLAEHADVRADLREQFRGDYRRDAAEEMGAEFILEAGERRALRRDAGGEAFRIHGGGIRGPDEVDASSATSSARSVSNVRG